jgi:aminopeptidase N
VIPVADRPKMVQIDAQGWLIKELDFEKSDDEHLFQLEHASSVLGRLEAGRALVKTAKTKSAVARALAAAWKREKSPTGKQEMCELICDGEETFRGALIDAIHDTEARVRTSAIAGLARLKHDEQSERVFRAAWTNPQEAYGARSNALRGLVAWKVKDADELLAKGLEVTADHHSIAATALGLLLETPGAKSRELAALFSKYGQPESLRANDDPTLQDILVELADDHDRSVRLQAWNAVRDLKVKKALPVLEARLARESADFGGNTRQILKEAIETLKDQPGEPKEKPRSTAEQASAIADLERQAADLEKKSKELRSRIAALKQTPEHGTQPATTLAPVPPTPTPATGTSDTSTSP